VGLLAVGLLSVPVSYVFLDRLKWILMPQFQPGRGLLFITAFAGIGGAIAAGKAAAAGRRLETLLWLLPAFAIPIEPRIFDLFRPEPAGLVTLAAVSALAALALTAEASRWRWASGIWAVAVLLPFWMIHSVAGTVNYPPLHSAELDQLSAWAKSATPKDSMFLFPDAGREIYPGVFRAKAIRAVYTDWKAGGQVNYHRSFAGEWWDRYRTTVQPGFDPSKLEWFELAGIDYLVLKPAHKILGKVPAYENSKFVVYRLKD
jgi:hypothetical protein